MEKKLIIFSRQGLTMLEVWATDTNGVEKIRLYILQIKIGFNV
jgi:hypothetical protein